MKHVTFTEGRTEPSEKHPEGQPDWRWSFKADNGEVVAVSSEGYVDRRDAITGFCLASGAALDLSSSVFVRHEFLGYKPQREEIGVNYVFHADTANALADEHETQSE